MISSTFLHQVAEHRSPGRTEVKRPSCFQPSSLEIWFFAACAHHDDVRVAAAESNAGNPRRRASSMFLIWNQIATARIVRVVRQSSSMGDDLLTFRNSVSGPLDHDRGLRSAAVLNPGPFGALASSPRIGWGSRENEFPSCA